jgi:hypothetical protein
VLSIEKNIEKGQLTDGSSDTGQPCILVPDELAHVRNPEEKKNGRAAPRQE